MKNPKFPIYIPTKGRYELMITSKVLTCLKINHYLVVEHSEVDLYLASIKKNKLLASVVKMDYSYKEKYDLCDNLGLSHSTGPGPARNCAWNHSMSNGHEWHWVMDDNIRSFRRLNRNEKVKVSDGAIFRAMEDFCLRYENVGMAGPNYFMFASARSEMPPFISNTRIYSCNLIRNDVPHRWRGRYNEDTILSLDMLKDGLCTVQFNAFLQEKMATQNLIGGNTGEFYTKEGTLPKSRMIAAVHPDISKISYRFGRCHHHVDYSVFKYLKLIKKQKLKNLNKVDNYGMELRSELD